VGDTINAASRLEGVAKELDVELVVSAETVARARLALDGRALRDVPVRGRRAPIAAFAVADAAALRAGAPTA
jgi:adenylate cyclase